MIARASGRDKGGLTKKRRGSAPVGAEQADWIVRLGFTGRKYEMEEVKPVSGLPAASSSTVGMLTFRNSTLTGAYERPTLW